MRPLGTILAALPLLAAATDLQSRQLPAVGSVQCCAQSLDVSNLIHEYCTETSDAKTSIALTS